MSTPTKVLYIMMTQLNVLITSFAFISSAVSSPFDVPRQIFPVTTTAVTSPTGPVIPISSPASTSLVIPTIQTTLASTLTPTNILPTISTAAGAPQSSSNVTNSKKAGLAWPNGKWADFTQYTATGKVTWYYTWSPFSVETAPTQLEFVPMLWGPSQVSDFQKTIDASIQAGSKHVLAMNEPQEAGQSNINAQTGAIMWQQYLQPLKTKYPDIRLGTPATSSAPSGKKWIQDFLGYCNNTCSVDFVALHWYDVNATAFIEYLTDFHNTFNLPIWVTEWSCQNFNDKIAQCTQQHIIDFLNVTQTFMDNTEWVERYSYFGVMKNLQGVNPYDAMMDTNGIITSLGEQYIGSKAPAIVDHTGDGPLAPAPGSSSSATMLCVHSLSLVFVLALGITLLL